MRWHPWTFAAGAGVLAGAGYLVVDGELARETLWRVTILGSCGALVLGVRLNRPAHRHPWWMLLAALSLIGIANLLTYPLWVPGWAQQVADLLSMVAFPLIGLGAVAIFRLQAPGGDRESALDGLIVMIAMATVLVGTAFHPDRVAHDGSTSSLLLNSVVAPIMMAAVSAATFRLLFIGTGRIVSVWLVVFASGAGLFGNTMRAWLGSQGTYERGVWTDVFILLSYVGVGLACLHPSSPQLTDRAELQRERFSPARVMVLGAALMAAPATLLIHGGAPRVPVFASLLLSTLVLVRLSHLVADRERSRRALHQQAVHDALTGLANRTLLLDRLELQLATSRRRGGVVAVMFVDLDGFKQVNDDHGHGAGDRLLIAVAERLREVVGEEDTVGRLAGDEFVVVSRHDHPAGARPVADRIVARLSEAVHLDDATVAVTASVGLVVAAADAEAEDVLAQADAAMYEAKAQPGGAVEVYDDRLDEQRRERRRMGRELADALDRAELELAYQPLVRPAARGDSSIVGVEALVRWTRRGRPVPPSAFIPVAENSDLILRLGDQVTEVACAQLAEWETYLPIGVPFTLYVNLSSRQLADPRLPGRVADILARTGVDPAHVGFEVSETAVLDDRAIAVATELSRLGVRLALDDFGTGFASIAHLRRLPLDLIKLDGSLVVGAVHEPEERAIVGAVVAVARELGIEVLAEQVETHAQLQLLESLGCRLVQGFLFARPEAADQVPLPFRTGALGPVLAGRGPSAAAAR